ncbi:hypothetical protein SAMN05216244_1387 [Sediminibacillus halophilus]|uniref:Uncharacterized protein n=1 Tax=Sediminibacillus halophilus TaxID=482461 RepID=A0A1G9PDM5_9BACI|nr:hypothetical protein SAMN05216244_1387 [Sediminibacillus halophilus]
MKKWIFYCHFNTWELGQDYQIKRLKEKSAAKHPIPLWTFLDIENTLYFSFTLETVNPSPIGMSKDSNCG